MLLAYLHLREWIRLEGAASDRSDGGFGHEFILYIVPDPQTLVEPVHKREGEAAGQHPVDKDRRQQMCIRDRYVVVEELVPQAHSKAGTCGFVGGFLIMMI